MRSCRVYLPRCQRHLAASPPNENHIRDLPPSRDRLNALIKKTKILCTIGGLLNGYKIHVSKNMFPGICRCIFYKQVIQAQTDFVLLKWKLFSSLPQCNDNV